MEELLAQIEASALESVPEAFRALYGPVEGQEGILRLKVKSVDGVALEDVTGLTATLTERREKHRKASARVEAFETALGDVALEDLPGVLTEYRALKANPPGKGGGQGGGLSEDDVEQRVSQLVGEKSKEWDTERAKLVDERDGAIGQLDKYLRMNVATKAILAQGGSVEVMLPHVMPHIGITVGEDGSRKAVVVDEKGEPREVLKDGQVVTVDPSDFVETQFKKTEAFGPAFAGAQVAGSGSRASTPGGGPASGNNPFAQTSFNLTEISRLVRENPTEAKRLKALAEQQGVLHPHAKRVQIRG